MRRRGAVWLAWGIGGTSLALAALSWLLHAKNAAASLPTTGRRRGDVGLLPARRAHRLPAATQPDRLAPGRHRLRHGRWGLRGRVQLLHGRDRSRLAPRRNPAGLARGCLTTDLAVLRAGPAAPAALPRRPAPISTLAPVAGATAA